MKEGLHPEYHPVVFVDSAADFELVTRSTKTSSETRQIDGVDHYVIRVEISSASHPFFTGEQRFIDTAGRVEKFQRRYEQFYQKQDDAKQKVVKKAEAAATATAITVAAAAAARVEDATETAAAEAAVEGVPQADATAEAEPEAAAEATGVDAAAEPTEAEALSGDGSEDDAEADNDPEAES
jgi:large subunit ribosomal protein L31